MCLRKKDFIPIILCFFALLGTAFPLKTFYITFHSTKNLHSTKKSTSCLMNKMVDFYYVLGSRFSFDAYAKNVREKETK